MSTIYNNFIYMYINLFLNNGLARKTKNSSTELLVITIKKGWLRIYVGMGETNLNTFGKNFKRRET